MIHSQWWRGLALGLILSIAGYGQGLAAEPSDTSPTTCLSPGPERPYLCDIGEPRPLSMRSFARVAKYDAAVREMLYRIGMPDRVELQQVDVEAPWTAWELRAYYRRYNRVYAFAQAMALGLPQISVLRYQGAISPAHRQAVSFRAGEAAASGAAERAERAAEEAERAADKAERAGERAEAISATLDRDFKSSLRKR